MDILVIGLGSMGKRRARLIKSLGEEFKVSGVDSQESRMEQAKELGITPYASIKDALSGNSFDAAFVCTAPLSHAEIINTLLDSGIPVFSEITLVDDGYNGIIKKAAAKNIPLFLSSTMLYRAETQYISKKVAEFGKPINYVYHIGQYLPDWHPWENYKDFFVGTARTGGVREILGIELPWLVSAFGKVDGVFGQQNTLSDLELPYNDSLFAMLHHSSGVMGFIAADVVSPKAVRNFEIYGDGLHLFWEGSPATLYCYDTNTKEKIKIDAYESYEQDSRYSDNIVENAYLDEIIEFFAVLEGKAVPKWSFAQDAEVIKVIERMLCGSMCSPMRGSQL